jgi:AbrB family looped-hinge helix DNA binding protein
MDLTTVSPKVQVVIPKRVHDQFGLSPGQQLQVLALPGRIELIPIQSPAALRGFLQADNTFQREPDCSLTQPRAAVDLSGWMPMA